MLKLTTDKLEARAASLRQLSFLHNFVTGIFPCTTASADKHWHVTTVTFYIISDCIDSVVIISIKN